MGTFSNVSSFNNNSYAVLHFLPEGGIIKKIYQNLKAVKKGERNAL